MPIGEVLVIVMFVTTFACLLAGFPVAFTLSGVAALFGLFSYAFGVFDISFLRAMPQRIFGNAMWNEVLIAVPLFIFMGVMLERSKVAEELLEAMGRLFGGLRGGIGLSVIAVGALLAASTGIVGATVVTMGLLSLPTMLRRGYDPKLATGTICASGTLGQIIPPSIVLVILGEQISNAYVDAQRAIGNWSPEPVSVGDLFAGRPAARHGAGRALHALSDGRRLAEAGGGPSDSARRVGRRLGARCGGAPAARWCRRSCSSSPFWAPSSAASRPRPRLRRWGAVGSLILAGARLAPEGGTRLERSVGGAPLYLAGGALILMMILAGQFDLVITRAGIGAPAVVAFICCGLLVYGIWTSLWRVWRAGVLVPVMRSTMQISAMVFVILIGAAMFSLVFRGLGGDEMVHQALSNVPGGVIGAMLVVMLIMFALGFFLDFIEINLRGGPDHRAGAAADGHQPDLARHHDGGEPADLVPDPAVRLLALLFARGGAAHGAPPARFTGESSPSSSSSSLHWPWLGLFPELTTWLPSVVFD